MSTTTQNIMDELEKLDRDANRRRLQYEVQQQKIREDIKALQPLAEVLAKAEKDNRARCAYDSTRRREGDLVTLELTYSMLRDARDALDRVANTPTHTRKSSRSGLPENVLFS
jgi:hypothetical protein